MTRSILLLTALCALFISALPISKAAAQDIADQPCDANYWRQMSSRAWMEAEREIMQNQNLIFKADSVLEYTCFDQFLAINGQEGGKIFTSTDHFNVKPIGETALADALQSVVFAALTNYRGNNFIHSYLGGRAEFMTVSNSNSFDGFGDYFKPANDTSNNSYTCRTMQDIWKAAKCANFIDNSKFDDTDGFYPFETIAGYKGSAPVDGYAGDIQETRDFPFNLSCASGAAGPRGAGAANLGVMGTWANQVKFSNNRGDALYPFETPVGSIYRDIGDKLEAGICGQPIYTGVTVVTNDSSNTGYPDGVCPNPGCSYRKKTNSAGECIANGAEAPI